MGKVAIITVGQKNSLLNQRLDKETYFNPTKNANDKWVISKEEIEQCTNEGFEFLNDLELTEHEPIVSELPIV